MPEFLEVLEDKAWAGMRPLAGNRPADWNHRLVEFDKLMANEAGMSTRGWQYRLEEASSTSDFPFLLGDTIDRKLLAAVRSKDPVMRAIARVDTDVANFNTVNRKAFDALMERLQVVSELGEYQLDQGTERQFTYALLKRGKKVAFSWESWINDDLGAFQRYPGALAEAARYTEDWWLTQLFWDADGPLDAYFNDGTLGQNGVSTNALNVANLQAALNEMTGSGANGTVYTSDAGIPVVNIPRYLVVPPALQMTAMEILRSSQLAVTDGGSATLTRTPAFNAIGTFGLTLIINPWIPSVCSTGTIGQTTWALFSETYKPCEIGFLRGHSAPELFVKSSGAQMGAGGSSDPFGGSFDNDSIEWKLRYVFNGTRLDPRGGWASDGQ